jgi:serine/threonine protein kinase
MGEPEFEYLGPYHVQRTLGRGGMGAVYKGVHAKSGDPVAIKVIASGIADQPRFRRRFASEIEALKRLKHPHIVELIGYGEERGMLFYSMEFVDGHSLHEHLRQHKRLPWEDVVQVGIEVTSALKHAHTMGIIHRDLKPANLMLNQKGGIKLTDFGISKLFGAAEETAAGSIIGTADYMPPEQAEGKPVTVRSDLYSLGCVLYALLAGKPPFGGKSVPEVLYAVRYSPVPDLASQASDAPAELVELIHQLLDKDPGKRPPTALVVGNRLKALQQGLQRMIGKTEESQPADKPTRVGNAPVAKELTSLDLSDVEDDELRLTGALRSRDSDRDETYHTDEPLATNDRLTVIASTSMFELKKELVSPSDAGTRIQSNDEAPPSKLSIAESPKPAVSQREPSQSPLPQVESYRGESQRGQPVGRADSRDEEPLSSGGPSHFTPVARDDGSRFETVISPSTSDPHVTDWTHLGSVIGIAALLIASIFTGWWLLQPEPVNDLYGRISTAVEAGDDNQLLAATGDMEQFLARFPNDERTPEIRELLEEAELVRRSRVLQRKASREGGLAELSAIEQAFLDCLNARTQNAAEAQKRIEAFLTVFGNSEDLDRSDRRLVELVRSNLLQNELRVQTPVPPAQLQLEKMIREAESQLKGKALDAYYRNLLVLYNDKAWASEQMNRIRSRLAPNHSGAESSATASADATLKQ